MVAQELEFYRKRSGQVYLLAFTAEVFILVGRDQIVVPAGSMWWSAWVHALFFFGVAFISTFLVVEYRRRIHILKDKRVALLDHAAPIDCVADGLTAPRDEEPRKGIWRALRAFFTGKDNDRSELGVLLATLWVTSAIGIALSFMGDRAQEAQQRDVACPCASAAPNG